MSCNSVTTCSATLATTGEVPSEVALPFSNQVESQLIAKALELPANLSTKTLVIGERILVARRILSNLLKVTPDWLICSDKTAAENGGLPHAS